MAADLIIGPLDSEIQEHVLRICKRIGLNGWPASSAQSSWLSRLIITPSQKPGAESIIISVLNNASLNAFNAYAAGLAGLSGPEAMMNGQVISPFSDPHAHLRWIYAKLYVYPNNPRSKTKSIFPAASLACRPHEAVFLSTAGA